jgi:hypothetical protein
MSDGEPDELVKVKQVFATSLSNALGVLSGSTENASRSAQTVGQLVDELVAAWDDFEQADAAADSIAASLPSGGSETVNFPLSPDILEETVAAARSLSHTVGAIEKQVKAVEREQVLQARGGM